MSREVWDEDRGLIDEGDFDSVHGEATADPAFPPLLANSLRVVDGGETQALGGVHPESDALGILGPYHRGF